MRNVSVAFLLGAAVGGSLSVGNVVGWNAAPRLEAQDSLLTVAPVGPDHGTTPIVAGPGTTDVYGELARQYDRFVEVDRTFSTVARIVAPSVVHIVARKPNPLAGRDRESSDIEETGSGVIVRPQGRQDVFVLTNHHVVQNSPPGQIKVTLHDGRVLTAREAWTDAQADIAVLDLGRSDLPAARLGDSDQAAVGHWVLAMGSPFGLTHSVSQGIISARNRHESELEESGVENQEFLQTDAAINPGNSGGPLVNLRGEVIGINTAIASSGGGSEGVGFSIPINLAKWIMEQLVTSHRVSRGALGVRLQDVSSERADRLGLDRPRGARILSVQEPSPAAQAGFLSGDVILQYNGVEVLDINHLINLVSRSAVGQRAVVVVHRESEAIELEVLIADRDELLAEDEKPSMRGQAVRRPAAPDAARSDPDLP